MQNKHIIIIICMLAFYCPVFAENTAAAVTVTKTAKYSFKILVLAHGSAQPQKEKPEFAWRVLKAYPLKIKEYAFDARYYGSTYPAVKAVCDKIIAAIPEKRQKNGVVVSRAVFDYVSAEIAPAPLPEGLSADPHAIFRTALTAIKDKQACLQERARLAVALLRCAGLPARSVYKNGAYAVEYYLKPLDKEGSWHTEEFMAGTGFDTPAAWYPLDQKEQLNETWKDTPVMLRQVSYTAVAVEAGKGQELFDRAAEGKAMLKDLKGQTAAKSYDAVIETIYELEAAEIPGQKVEVVFNMPFNLRDDFKTSAYKVLTEDKRVKIYFKRTHTKANASQHGILYTLPVTFTLE